jgi:phenylalanyl-tRNA synthetase beta chain
VVELANPLSEEASLMRSSLVPGMLNMLAYNLNRGTENVRLFEIGDVYELTANGAAEHARICLGVSASALQQDLPMGAVLDKSKAQSLSDVFRLLKGDVEKVLGIFEHQSLTFDRQATEYYDAGCSARALLDGGVIAQFGKLSPQIAAERKIRADVFLAEIFADRLFQRPLRKAQYCPLPKFPSTERDFSFVFAEEVTFEKILSAIQSLDLAELRSFVPVEIFRGGSVAPGKYSILLRARFQSLDRTLREDEVAEWSAKIVGALTELGGAQRA